MVRAADGVADATSQIEEQLRAAQLAYRSRYDRGTGLANRDELRAWLEAAFDRGARPAIVLLGLGGHDGLDLVHDAFGYATVRELVAEAGARIEDAMGEDARVALAREHELVVVRLDVAGERDARSTAERVLEELDRPFRIGDVALRLPAAAGVAVSEGPDDRPERLLRDGGAALRGAIRTGDRVVAFGPGVHDDARSRCLATFAVRDESATTATPAARSG